MAKNIIHCSDGTWDSADSDTNVVKFWRAMLINASQTAIYDDGLGADGTPLEKLTGGAFGDGIFQKIKTAYTRIAHVYVPGDQLFLFGFSRGAYTARSLAGMIAICGLPAGDFSDDMVETAFQAYRNPVQRAEILASLSDYKLFDAKLSMVGVWDTVGSLGIPAIFGGVEPLMYGFLDTSLHPDVLHAYQALAIDERRREFPPTLWTSAPAPGQTIEQIWFSGVHCDVGGGYPETGLSDVTLCWMLQKAIALGVQVNPTVAAQCASIDPENSLGQIHESWNLLWGFPNSRSIAANASLSNSVVIRCQHTGNYHPGNLQLTNGAPAGAYGIVPVVAPPPQPPAPQPPPPQPL